MPRRSRDTPLARLGTPPGLERSGPVFHRARRLAMALFGPDAVGAEVVLLSDGRVWRSTAKGAMAPPDSPLTRRALETGAPVWVADIREDAELRRLAEAGGGSNLRFCICAPIRLEDGGMPGALAVLGKRPCPYDANLADRLQDLADLVGEEWALIQARDAAQAANRAKSAFVATISHEIRTPLNGLMGMVEAMSNGELEPMQRERLEVIRSSSDGLLTILNDLLDLSKIEAGKLTLEDGEFDVVQLAEGVRAIFQAVADAKGLTLALSVSSAARGAYRGDVTRLRQVLHNLVSNALKFTEQGMVAIAVRRRSGQLQLTVRDSGIGMSAEQQRGLFRAFEQAEASTARRFGGTGLGLAICRDLVEMMGGAISVASGEGRGARFTVSLPLEKVAARPARMAEAAASAAPKPQAERTLKVLAAEDNNVNQLVLRTLLNQVGVEPTMVDDGHAAVEAWAREPWDLILMDVQMPGLDGPSATREIRAREARDGRARTPIVALTANAFEDQVAAYLEVGMDGFVAKPIAASRLFAAIDAVLDLSGATTAEAAA